MFEDKRQLDYRKKTDAAAEQLQLDSDLRKATEDVDLFEGVAEGAD